MAEDRKRRHHYVWRHYLDGWANLDGRVWCQRNGARFLAATENLGVRKDFYALKEMSDTDLRWVELLVIDRMPDPRGREVARGWIPMFRDVFKFRDAARLRGVTSAELDAELETHISNIEENLHAGAESKAVSVLDALRGGDASVLASRGTYADFALFLGHQYMRTPKIATRTIAAVAEARGFNASAAWGLMRTIFAMNIGGQLFVRRTATNFCMLEAGPSSRFIAGDQPIVNLGGIERSELYYPLTPTRALMIVDGHSGPGIEAKKLTDSETHGYNLRIRDAAEEQIYAASETTLRDLDD